MLSERKREKRDWGEALSFVCSNFVVLMHWGVSASTAFGIATSVAVEFACTLSTASLLDRQVPLCVFFFYLCCQKWLRLDAVLASLQLRKFIEVGGENLRVFEITSPSFAIAIRNRCEAVTGSNEATTPKSAWMRDGNLDATLWKQIPDEILEHILGFLPFPNVFRCATVCQQWRAICQRPRLHLNVTNSWPSYCPVRYSHTDSGALQWYGFSIATNKWQAMPAIDLPASPGKCLLTGAGGLLAICRPRAIIVVVNPVTGERRTLPEPIQKWSRPDVLHMIADPQGGYKIILAGTEAYSARKSQPTEVYDSVTGRWSLTGSLPADLYLDPQDGTLDGHGRLVCTAQKALAAGATFAGTDALVAYDVRHGVWSEVASDLPDESARQTPLETNGRTLMAVAPVDDDGPVGRLYVLNSGCWELLASMPEPLHRRVRSWGACVVSGHHVVVVSDTAHGCVVSYDLSQGTWSERRSPIKFSSKASPLSCQMRLLAPISFHPDVLASP